MTPTITPATVHLRLRSGFRKSDFQSRDSRDLKAQLLALTLKVAELEKQIAAITPKPRSDRADNPVKCAAISVPTSVWNQTASEFCSKYPNYLSHKEVGDEVVEAPNDRAICEALGALKFRTITLANIRQAFEELEAHEKGEVF